MTACQKCSGTDCLKWNNGYTLKQDPQTKVKTCSEWTNLSTLFYNDWSAWSISGPPISQSKIFTYDLKLFQNQNKLIIIFCFKSACFLLLVANYIRNLLNTKNNREKFVFTKILIFVIFLCLLIILNMSWI